MLHYAAVLHRQYGPIVRFGTNRLLIEGSVCWPEVYGARSTSDENEFGKVKGFAFPNDHLALIGTNREDHRRQRRQMAHAFSANALKEQEQIMMQHVDKFIARLTDFSNKGQTFDMVRYLNLTTFDIIGDLTFADSFHGLDGDETFVENFDRGTAGLAYRRFMIQYPLLKPLVALYAGSEQIAKAAVAMKENFLVGERKGRERMALGAEPKGGRRDFATYMLRTGKTNNSVLSDEEVRGISSVLVAAGSETTSTALSGFTFFYSMYPEKRQRLVDEVRKAFTDESQINITSTQQLQYLHAVIEETLRMYPPAATLPPRASPGAPVNGQWIPRGTIIHTYMTATNLNPDSFADADSFEPERWLPQDHPFYDPRFAHDKKQVVKPFSNGSRDCIGKNLAYAEMAITISRILFRFDIEMLPGQEDWVTSQRAGILRIKGPLMVRLKNRSGDSME
ncbi:hypothetical protein NX059_011776 [Plenodomus lindquistii]|nr:hypothetical protein NX059_011776 [Plenodomus lindquistii]